MLLKHSSVTNTSHHNGDAVPTNYNIIHQLMLETAVNIVGINIQPIVNMIVLEHRVDIIPKYNGKTETAANTTQ